MTEINEIAETICRDLPEGFEVILCLENGYGGIKLLCPEGRYRDCDDPDMPINEQLIHALRMAEELSREAKP